MNRFRDVLKSLAAAAALIACATATFAAGMSPDPTGLWFRPDEAGWGMSLTQQGNTLFAALFVYDASRRPAWYVATDVRAQGSNDPATGQPIFGGTLYRTSGPPFGTPFDPRGVTATAVGDLQLRYVAGASGPALGVAYSIDGTSVSTTVQPQTWSDNAALLAGSYDGSLVMATKSPDGACPPMSFGYPDTGREIRLNVSSGPGASDIRFLWGTGIDTVCTLSGTYAQRGQLGTVAGTLACGPLGFPGPALPIQLGELAIGPHGFAGLASWQNGSCSYTGHFGGVREP